MPSAFRLHIIPNRKFYYLPYRPGGVLQWIRFFQLYQGYIKKVMKVHHIDLMFGVINGSYLSPLVAYVQQKTNIPLFSFFHDDTTELDLSGNLKAIKSNTRAMLKASNTVFIASDAFKDNWSIFSHKFQLLFPIPSIQKGFGERKKKSTIISIGYSGTFYAETLPFFTEFCAGLKDLHARLTIIGNNTNIDYLQHNYRYVEALPLFSTAEESNDFLHSNCDLGLIIYPEKVSQMPWIKTCFPSKFIQFCSIGLPTLVIAPKDSAVGKWCIDNHWPLYLERISMHGIKHFFSDVLYTEELNERISYFQNQTFNAEKIHAQLVNKIIQNKM